MAFCNIHNSYLSAFLYIPPPPSPVSTQSYPVWLSSDGRINKDFFSEETYLSQLGSGQTAEESRTDAAGALARYFRTTVDSRLATSMVSVSENSNITETVKIQNDVSVTSQVELFSLEYTEPFYSKKEKKYWCVAYLKRADAWNSYVSQIESAESVFLNFYQKAVAEPEPFFKLQYYKNAWDEGTVFLEKLEYGLLVTREHEAKFADSREKVLTIPSAMEEERKNMTIEIRIQGDFNGIVENAVAQSFSEVGFSVGKSFCNYIALVSVSPNTVGDNPLSVTPSVDIILSGKNGDSFYSFSCSAEEETISYTLDTARGKSYPVLAEKIKQSLVEDFTK